MLSTRSLRSSVGDERPKSKRKKTPSTKTIESAESMNSVRFKRIPKKGALGNPKDKGSNKKGKESKESVDLPNPPPVNSDATSEKKKKKKQKRKKPTPAFPDGKHDPSSSDSDSSINLGPHYSQEYNTELPSSPNSDSETSPSSPIFVTKKSKISKDKNSASTASPKLTKEELWCEVFKGYYVPLHFLMCTLNLKTSQDIPPNSKSFCFSLLYDSNSFCCVLGSSLASDIKLVFMSLALQGVGKPLSVGEDRTNQISALQSKADNFVLQIRSPSKQTEIQPSLMTSFTEFLNHQKPGTDSNFTNSSSSRNDPDRFTNFKSTHIRTTVFNNIRKGNFASTAELNSHTVECVIDDGVKKKTPLYPPTTFNEFLDWLRLIISIIEDSDFEEFTGGLDVNFTKNEFDNEMDKYYRFLTRMSKGVPVSTLFAVDNRIRSHTCAARTTWTKWSPILHMEINLELLNASHFAKHCDNCSSIFCVAASCRYQRNKRITSTPNSTQRRNPHKNQTNRRSSTSSSSGCFSWAKSGSCMRGVSCHYSHATPAGTKVKKTKTLVDEEKSD